MIEFFKYQGAGNDFILINNIDHLFSGDKVSLANRLCDRHFGIGSDGLIFIERTEGADFLMDFYNPDGSQSFCGNGSRCAVAFAKKLNLFASTKVSFKAIDGIHHAELNHDLVKVSMQNVSNVESIGADIFMNTGSPHYVMEVPDVEKSDIITIGKKIRYDAQFEPGGTNVNIIQVLGEHKIAIRTYERGVEDETLACGTGATASALVFALKQDLKSGIIEVNAVGGQLKVYFTMLGSGFKDIYLEGPAKVVFKGEIDV